MKQAILITAYKEIDSLMDIINSFDSNFNFYIHVDKKRKLNSSNLSNIKNVFVSTKYAVNWGGVNHLKAILLLANQALLNKDNSFFHLITGEDFPAKSVDHFLSLDTSKNYLHHFDMPAAHWSNENGGFDRINYYQLYDILNAKNLIEYKFIRKIESFQKRLKMERSFPKMFPKKLYGGSTYWSLNRDALQYVINYTNENKLFLKRFNNTFCAEEIYFQTILLNSSHASSVVNNNLRHIDWDSGRGGRPAFLDETDLDKIILSDNLFARKIQNSGKLKPLLIKHCQKEKLRY
jgi:hypothetical protein